MKHEQFKQWLYLSAFDEIDEDAERQLSEHVATCEECRREREEIVRMLDAVAASGVGEPTEEMLSSARQSLQAALWRETAARSATESPARRESFATRLLGIGRGGWYRGYRTALATAALVAFGFLVGYLASERLNPGEPIQQEELVTEDSYTGIADIRFLDADAADGELDIIYNQVRPTRLKSRVDDERMRELLTYALLNGDNPGVRLKAINALDAHQSVAPPADMKQAFLEALVTDPNAGVRMQALLVLRRLPFDDDIKRTLLFVLLHDENEGIRVAVMNFLAEITLEGGITEQEMYEILEARAKAARSSAVRTGPGIFSKEME